MFLIELLVTLMFIASVFMFLGHKLIAANIYKRTVINKEGKPSPYSFSREFNRKGDYGYSLTCNNKLIRVNGNSNANDQYVVYSDFGTLMKEMNRLEHIGGYKLTTFSGEDNT